MGVLLPLQALTAGQTDVDIGSMESWVIEHALTSGLGPVLAHVTADAETSELPYAERIRAADLTARILTAEKYEVLADVLDAARAVGCRPVLLKGVATALRYYPSPHLRAMGDIDLLVPTDGQPAVERRLRSLGFQQSSHEPAAAFLDRHHSMPFWHPERQVWIEVHSRLHPRQHPLAHVAQFSPEAVASELSEIEVGNQKAYVLNHERQLVYTSARWSETFDHQRGIYPMLDAALLIHSHGHALDWDRIHALVKGSWATTALRLMVTYLIKSDLAYVPGEVLTWLAANDHHTNRVSIWLLHQLVTRYLVKGRPLGAVLTTENNVGAIWGSLVRPALPWVNILKIPYSLGGSVYRRV